MRYTIDELGFPDTDLPAESPLMVEVHLPDATTKPIRDPAGKVRGRTPSGLVGRESVQLFGDVELLERLRPLCNSLRVLDEHIDWLRLSHSDGSEPESPDEEAHLRTEMRFGWLVAHALVAVELVTREG